LAALYDFAVENDSDIVVGKMAGIGRPVAQGLFRQTRPIATLANTPLMDSLTVHKLFRRAFLIEKGIRFAEGRRRLEDHLFMAQAYLEAGVISVYADETCYFHTRSASNASAQTPHWPSYFANLEEAVEVVEQHTEPGPFRDRLLSRWLRVEMVKRLSGRALSKRSPDEVTALFDAAHQVARRHFSDGAVALINPADRPVGRAIVDGTLTVVWERADLLSGWQVDGRILQIGWCDTTLQLCGTITLVDHTNPQAGGAETRFCGLFADWRISDLEAALAAGTVSVDLENPRTGERRLLPATTRGLGLARSFTVDIDIAQLRVDPSANSRWAFHAQFQILGVGGRVAMSLIDERSLQSPVAPSTSTRPAAVVSSDGSRVELVVSATVRPPRPRTQQQGPLGTARYVLRRSGRVIRNRLGQRGSRTT
jgi:poly(ribitol-phosphate) beta-N-acetylglucosaminyltransferase